MKVLGIRHCAVMAEAEGFADFLEKGLGLPARDLGGAGDAFTGSVFPAGDGSWVEIWPVSDEMPEMTMLQIVVDDAEGWAEQARSNGLSPHGPTIAHGECIYYLQAPNGAQFSFQSKIE